MMEFFSLDFVKLSVPLLAGVVAWFVNERRKRAWEEYVRKEENYKALLLAFKGFYVATGDRNQKLAFLDQVNLCWLYCPDHIVQKAYAFLATVHTDAKHVDADKERVFGELVAGLRKDLLSRRITKKTALTASDFRHLTAT